MTTSSLEQLLRRALASSRTSSGARRTGHGALGGPKTAARREKTSARCTSGTTRSARTSRRTGCAVRPKRFFSTTT
jgi:hypothetical protein